VTWSDVWTNVQWCTHCDVIRRVDERAVVYTLWRDQTCGRTRCGVHIVTWSDVWTNTQWCAHCDMWSDVWTNMQWCTHCDMWSDVWTNAQWCAHCDVMRRVDERAVVCTLWHVMRHVDERAVLVYALQVYDRAWKHTTICMWNSLCCNVNFVRCVLMKKFSTLFNALLFFRITCLYLMWLTVLTFLLVFPKLSLRQC
jgi:hypothetical protein